MATLSAPAAELGYFNGKSADAFLAFIRYCLLPHAVCCILCKMHICLCIHTVNHMREGDLTCAFKGRMMGKGSQGTGSLQRHATTLALGRQSSVQLDQQALMQVARAALHHLAQWHLQVVCILCPWRLQVHRCIVVQMHIQTCSIAMVA